MHVKNKSSRSDDENHEKEDGATVPWRQVDWRGSGSAGRRHSKNRYPFMRILIHLRSNLTFSVFSYTVSGEITKLSMIFSPVPRGSWLVAYPYFLVRGEGVAQNKKGKRTLGVRWAESPYAGEILKIYAKFACKILKFWSDNILFTRRF